MKQMTYVSAIEAALCLVRNLQNGVTEQPTTFTRGEETYTLAEVESRLSALALSLEKRNSSAASKPTKTQTQNADIKEHLLGVMSCGEAHTVTDWQALDETLGELSNQKVSALLRQLVIEGKVVKAPDKRRTLFKLA